MSMRIYEASAVIFPKSLHLRLFALCFLATHIPLLSFILLHALAGRFQLWETLLLTGATVVGAVLAIGGIWALLAPVRSAAQALADLEQGRMPTLPSVRNRDIGAELLAGINRAAYATERRTITLDAAAHRDVLTGTYNRRGLLARMEDHVGSEGTLALLDLDYFKQVNDALGHAAGDRVLRDFAARISAETRKQDLLARWGGEEFAIFFPGTVEAQATAVLERVSRAMVSSPLAMLDTGPVTFSAGTAQLGAETLEEALSRADRALYAAKQYGRNQIVSATERPSGA
ncbi:GGDEF domain-containing protein [Sphingomonas sp. S2-65]|uniref:GGDEF domain-containing protein n=1 Tax=Sphingomonas sp. S2-65 TaxID=2903960 RepID=UPI001F224B1A|nr:GGDEF domain-containing protein [Sphingomonas sp. S2-65]UYY59516.1 GGDEF domain-containing protein [Sphingomonas sp. S2-65]